MNILTLRQTMGYVLLSVAFTNAAALDTTYFTLEVPSAVGFGPSFADGFIRGDGSDVDLNATFGVPPAFSNPNGDLSYGFNYDLPSGQLDNYQFWNLAATLPDFRVTADGVTIDDWSFSGTQVGTNSTTWTLSQVPAAGSRMLVNSDGTMQGQWTTRFDSSQTPGLFAETETANAAGLYILNQPGRDDATAINSPPLLYPGGAQFLNFVRDEYLNGDGIQNGGLDWTQAAIWFFDGDYTQGNTTGTAAPFLIGGSYVAYHVWYSTDPWLYGNPLGDPTPNDVITPADLAQMVIDQLFPDTAGIVLPGEQAVQVWDIDLQSGDGTSREVVFEYDPGLLPLGFDEMTLRIAHYVSGAWEVPANQIVDVDANTVTLTVDSFSPFALTSVPIPPALLLFGSAIMSLLMVGKGRRGRPPSRRRT